MGNNWSEAQYIIDELLYKLSPILPVDPGEAEFKTPGTYNFTIPPKVKEIKIEAYGATSGGGGGGGGGGGAQYIAFTSLSGFAGGSGAGGGGGAAGSLTYHVIGTYPVTPGDILQIVIGAGGTGGSGGDGGTGGITTPSYSDGSSGRGGGTGNPSTATYIRLNNSSSDILVFPQAAGGNAGAGGGGGQYWRGTMDNGSAPGGTNGYPGAGNIAAVKPTYISSFTVLLEETSTTNSGKTDGGRYGMSGTDGVFQNSNTADRIGGYGGTGGNNNSAEFGPGIGGTGGYGGQGRSKGSSSASQGGTGSKGGIGSKGRDGYVKISWGY